MAKYNKPELREKLSDKSEKLVADLIQSIVGQIIIVEGKKTKILVLFMESPDV